MYRQTALVADVATSRGIINIKSAALLFDRIDILITPEGKLDAAASKSLVLGVPASELEWLLENNIVSTIDDPSETLLKGENNEENTMFANYRRAELGHILLLGGSFREDHYKSLANFATRYAASKLDVESDESRFVPISYESRFRLDKLGATIEYPFSDKHADKYGVATASILSKVIVPEDSTPWESILEFRSDRANAAAFFYLRRFAKEISSASRSSGEIIDEIENSLYVTERALDRAKLKYRTAVMETSVVAAISALENLVKFKWSEIAKSAFGLRKTREEFLASEAEIAESSMYYVVKANQELGGRE